MAGTDSQIADRFERSGRGAIKYHVKEPIYEARQDIEK